MISAATAAVAVLVIPLVRDYGAQYLFAASILMGLIQIATGFARLDLLMQFVSRSVITGFVNALAILIFRGTASPTDRRGPAGLRHDCRRFGYHLSASAFHEGGAIAPGGNFGSVRHFHLDQRAG